MIFVTVSTGHFDPLIRECDKLFRSNPEKYDFFGQIGSGTYVPTFPHVKVMSPEALDQKMEEAEIVVSHGGTGMLSRLYRLKKRAIVIPKQMRYGEANDGQVELAVKWGELGMALLCMDVKDLEASIRECRIKEFSFPIFKQLGQTLDKLIL